MLKSVTDSSLDSRYAVRQFDALPHAESTRYLWEARAGLYAPHHRLAIPFIILVRENSAEHVCFPTRYASILPHKALSDSLHAVAVQVMMAMSIGPWPRRTKKGKGSIVEILEGFATLTMAAIIMRLELVAFILPAALQSLFDGTTGFVELVLAGIVAAVLSLGQSSRTLSSRLLT